MKVSFIHTGDLHLGRQFHFSNRNEIFGNNTRNDLWKTFEKIINTAEKNKINFLLISGDLFDTEEIEIGEIKRVAQKLGKLTMTKTIICPGNHDYYSQFTLYGLIQWPENVYLFDKDKMSDLYFPEWQTRIFGLGWVKDTYTNIPFNDHMSLKEEENNILMLHGDAYNSQSELMPIDISKFDYFDYVALGHIHKSDFLTRRVAYCGCPEPLSFKDRGDHGIIVGQIEQHRCTTHFVSTQKRQFVDATIEVTPEMSIDNLREACLKIAPEKERMVNYYRIHLKGYRDTSLSVKWLIDECIHLFYYIEIEDDELKPDLDVDRILDDNRDNIIGQFIQAMRRDPSDPVAQKALYYGLEGLLKDGEDQ
ncbi:MAG: DNA repair exonuclease [Eubacteriaceae bacterium]|nr:DNA repair exonuclease [Eubacteriaceae bacterium]